MADEFVERLDRGERVGIEEYAERYPQIASEIRQVLPALAVMQPAGENAEPVCDASMQETHVPGTLGDFLIIRPADLAAAASPQIGAHWQTLGSAHFRNGSWLEAIAALEQAGNRGAGSGSSLFMLAIADGKLGNTDQARDCYQQAMEWMKKNREGDVGHLLGYDSRKGQQLSAGSPAICC